MNTTSTEELARAAVVAGLDYSGEDRATEEMIVSALLRLPEDVRTFATERCRFVSIGDQAHADGASSADDRWLVEIPDGVDEASLGHDVASAVAHAWLSRDLSDQDTGGSGDGTDDKDAQARELVAAWEFTGPGADA